jgi:geranylgeranyl pyrophosphate synthase
MSHSSDFLQNSQKRVNAALEYHLDLQASPYTHQDDLQLQRLKAACAYSVNNGGKRLRPALLYATAQCLNATASAEDLDLLAASIECIHSYSLVHDDLPAMDDDDLRRGKPTCHIAYDEPTAILVGDGLQAYAFELITKTGNLNPSTQVQLIKTLAQAAGNYGMVGGQMIDLQSANRQINADLLEHMHRLKTGALIRASVIMGAIAANADKHTLTALDNYARAIGLAFQVQDDILDIESDTQTLGKPQGADIKLNKPTYPALLGLLAAKSKAAALIQDAHTALDSIAADCSLLHELADFIVSRSH